MSVPNRSIQILETRAKHFLKYGQNPNTYDSVIFTLTHIDTGHDSCPFIFFGVEGTTNFLTPTPAMWSALAFRALCGSTENQYDLIPWITVEYMREYDQSIQGALEEINVISLPKRHEILRYRSNF